MYFKDKLFMQYAEVGLLNKNSEGAATITANQKRTRVQTFIDDAIA